MNPLKILSLSLLINIILPIHFLPAQDGSSSAEISDPWVELKPLWSKLVDPRWEAGKNVGKEDDGITAEFVEFSADGRYLVTGNGLGEAFVLDSRDGTINQTFTYIEDEDLAGRTEFDISGGKKKGMEVECGAFTPDGQYVILGGNLKGVQVYDLSDGSLYRHIQVDEEVDGLGVSDDGRYLAHAAPMSAEIIDLSTWDQVARIQHGNVEGVINSAEFSSDGKLLVSAGNYGHVLVNRTSDWERVGDGTISSISSIKSVRFSPDDKMIAAGYSDGELVVYNTEGMSVVWEYPLFYIEAVAWSQDGKYLLAGGRDNKGRLRIYDTSNWKLVGDPEVQADRSNIEYIDVFEDRIAVVGEDAHVRVYRLISRK